MQRLLGGRDLMEVTLTRMISRPRDQGQQGRSMVVAEAKAFAQGQWDETRMTRTLTYKRLVHPSLMYQLAQAVHFKRGPNCSTMHNYRGWTSLLFIFLFRVDSGVDCALFLCILSVGGGLLAAFHYRINANLNIDFRLFPGVGICEVDRHGLRCFPSMAPS